MADLADRTMEMYRTDPPHEGDKAQVIYLTGTGQDYCRETAPADVRTYEGALAWARDNFVRRADSHARGIVCGFRIEWW